MEAIETPTSYLALLSLILHTRALPLIYNTNPHYLVFTPSSTMAGGKKAKRGGTAKKKQLLDASPPIERHTAFIETSGGSDRVFPREVCNTIYRYLLLGHNAKKQRASELWKSKGFADYYCCPDCQQNKSQ
jgi:hypothetical protein